MEVQMSFQLQLRSSCGLCWNSFASVIHAHHLCMVWWEMCWVGMLSFQAGGSYLIWHPEGMYNVSCMVPKHSGIIQTPDNQSTLLGTVTVIYTMPGAESLRVPSCLYNCFYGVCLLGVECVCHWWLQWVHRSKWSWKPFAKLTSLSSCGYCI